MKNFQNLSSENHVLTLEQFSAYSGYKKSYIYQLIYHRKIPVHKPLYGRKVFFLKKEIDDWLLARRLATIDELKATTFLNSKK